MTLHLVTGGIGTGKSLVTTGLAALGWDTADADKIGHLVLTDEAREDVADRFPTVVTDEGSIDRGRLGAIVFADERALTDLEALTHPHIRRRIEELAGGEVVLEASDPSVDLLDVATTVIVVDAPESVRRGRLIARGMTPDDIDRRMANQPDRAEWLALADMVIPNEGSLTQLDTRIATLHTWLTTR